MTDIVTAITELKRNYKLAALLELAGIPRSTYCYYCKKAQSKDKYELEKSEITAIYKENQGRYGYRRILMELRNRGYVLNHKTVQKLMKELGLKCMVRMKKYRSYRGEAGKTTPNLLNRDFYAEKPNPKWTTDVTEFSLFGRKLHLSPILDMYNGENISYAISERANFEQITEMLDKAFEKLPDNTGLIFHSDQGWQYQNARYQKRLSELLYLREFCSFNEFQTELELYLEYYNHSRIKEKLGGLSPVQYRIQAGFAA